jgi:hypothetical protein
MSPAAYIAFECIGAAIALGTISFTHPQQTKFF